MDSRLGAPGPAPRSAVRVAVVGCGHLGTFHARLYRELPGAELIAVCDLVPEKARTLGEALGVSWTTDRAEAFARAEAVSIATPTTTHAEVALDAVSRGLHLLVEKPLAATVGEGEAMVRAAAVADRVLAVGHVERWNPAFRSAIPYIRAPRFVESHRLSTFVPRSLDVDVVLDLMIHDLDLTLALMPADLESIDAVGIPVLTAGEDIANARLRFADGAVANLTASRVSRERVRKIRFFGERRYISLDLMERKVEQVALTRIGAAAPEGARGTGVPPEEAALVAHLGSRGLRLEAGQIEVPDANPLRDQLADFLDAVRGGRLAGADGAAGLRSLGAALEVRAKVRESLRRMGHGGEGAPAGGPAGGGAAPGR